jgi:hypothetical protein
MAHEGDNNKEDKGGNDGHKQAQTSKRMEGKVGAHICATPAATAGAGAAAGATPKTNEGSSLRDRTGEQEPSSSDHGSNNGSGSSGRCDTENKQGCQHE